MDIVDHDIAISDEVLRGIITGVIGTIIIIGIYMYVDGMYRNNNLYSLQLQC